MTDHSSSSDSPLAPEAALARLGRLVLGSEPLGVVLEQVAGLAARSIPGVDEVSVTLVERRNAWTAAFTGSLAVQLDERQYENGYGPCTDAALSGQTIELDIAHHTAGRTGSGVADRPVGAPSAYPDFVDACRRAGVTHVVSVGLPDADGLVAALNLYTSTVDRFPAGSVALAQSFAGHAAIAVGNAARYQRTADLVDDLRAAMTSRSVIEQAKGILAERHGHTPDEAFEVLTRISQSTHRKLRDVAADLVAQTRDRRPS